MEKMKKMVNQKMVMDLTLLNRLISKFLDYSIRISLIDWFRKMFVGGLSWQTAPGRYHLNPLT